MSPVQAIFQAARIAELKRAVGLAKLRGSMSAFGGKADIGLTPRNVRF
jgi:hypothetical protein